MTQALASDRHRIRAEESCHTSDDRQKTGKLRDDILNEKILSAIVEFKTRIENVSAGVLE